MLFLKCCLLSMSVNLLLGNIVCFLQSAPRFVICNNDYEISHI